MPSMLPRVRAEVLPQIAVSALAEEVQIEIAERRQEAIRVVALPRRAVGEVKAQAVVEGRAHRGKERREEPGPVRLEGPPATPGVQAITRRPRRDGTRARPRRARRSPVRDGRRGSSAGSSACRRGGERDRRDGSPSFRAARSLTTRATCLAERSSTSECAGEMQRLAAQHASLGGGRVDQLVPVRRAVRRRQPEGACARASVQRQEQRVASIGRPRSSVSSVALPVDQHAEHVVLGIVPIGFRHLVAVGAEPGRRPWRRSIARGRGRSCAVAARDSAADREELLREASSSCWRGVELPVDPARSRCPDSRRCCCPCWVRPDLVAGEQHRDALREATASRGSCA